QSRSQYRNVFALIFHQLPQLQCRQSEEGEDDRQNPEPDNHRIFFPAAQFEMMMEWRHRENTLAGQSKAQDLEDHGNRFEHENTTHDRKKQFLFAADRNDSDHSADRERPRVTHDNSRGMTIEPKKAETGSHERRTDYG